MKNMAILTDVTRCIGCEACVTACKTTNNTGVDKPWRWQQRIDDLSATRWTTLMRVSSDRFIRHQCRHCLEPACVSACPVGALKKTPEGAVIYDSKICMGCRYCMMACPFGIPRYLWSEPVPYVRKCILCYGGLKNGTLEEPACTKACPTEATVFGERDELLALAKDRIRDNPGRYIDKIYGEDEVGGTSVLYISDVDLSILGWKRDLGTDPLPAMTWRAQKTVPFVFAAVGAVMAGTCWVIDRRMKLAAGDPAGNEDSPDRKTDDSKEKEAKTDA